MNMYQLNFDFDAFLKTYWQKKPTVIRKGFDNFEDALTPDELAGLAMEEEVDSRLVIQKDGQWLVSHGPFDSFDELPDTGSQLIVQASNHWHPGPQALAEPFRILPGWLFDDVMICYSLPGGGVGPHIDQYDVFIIQGSGRRHWRVGDLGNYEEANLHTGLRQITGFDAIIDTVLEPGDILYIPPGFPHEGTSLEESMSFSVATAHQRNRNCSAVLLTLRLPTKPVTFTTTTRTWKSGKRTVPSPQMTLTVWILC